jgi:hypothetical protein
MKGFKQKGNKTLLANYIEIGLPSKNYLPE